MAAALAMISAVAGSPAAADPSQSAPAPASPSPSQQPETSAPASGRPSSTSSTPAPSTTLPPVGGSADQTETAPPAATAQIEVSGNFDKPSYATGDQVKITFTVRNVGLEPATDLTVFNEYWSPTELRFDLAQWRDLSTGATIEPGASYQVELSGRVGNPDADAVTLVGQVFEDGFGVADFAFSAPVTPAHADAAGRVFGDGDGDGVFDAGEELAGISVTWINNLYPSDTHIATTDAQGRFELPDLPTVQYQVGAEVVDGWLVPLRLITIGPEGADDLLIRAVHPLNGALAAELSFDQDTYAPGELAHITVTLTNSSQQPLTGIVAACNRVGSSYGINTGPAWGDLDYGAPGVAIPPGQTRVFDVAVTVPDAAFTYGEVFVACDFGYAEVDIDNHANAADTAAVPGAVGSLVGDVLSFPNGYEQPGVGLAGVRVVLVGTGHCPIVGDTVTDGQGHFAFQDVPVSWNYQVYLVPPAGWKIKHGNPTNASVSGGHESQLRIEVEQGTGQLPTVPTQPDDCADPTTPPTTSPMTPHPQGRSSGGLASTGVNAGWLAVLGLGTILLGVGAVLAGRRRRQLA